MERKNSIQNFLKTFILQITLQKRLPLQETIERKISQADFQLN